MQKLELAANGTATGTRSRAMSQLRQDLLPLIAILSLNTTLTSLDITGHQMGNKGATALGKALQINNKLLHIAWDDNGTTLPGFSYFRIGISGNKSVVRMPLPLVDINLAMKGAFEAGSTNEKLLQVIRDIEQCVYRNAAAMFASSSARTGATGASPSIHLDGEGSSSAQELATAQENANQDEATSRDFDGEEELDEDEEDDDWTWSITGNDPTPSRSNSFNNNLM